MIVIDIGHLTHKEEYGVLIRRIDSILYKENLRYWISMRPYVFPINRMIFTKNNNTNEN